MHYAVKSRIALLNIQLVKHQINSSCIYSNESNYCVGFLVVVVVVGMLPVFPVLPGANLPVLGGVIRYAHL